MDRRGFLKAALALTLYLGPVEALAKESESRSTLRLYNTHTEEYLTVTYRDEKGYIPQALEKLNNLMRCHYNNKVRKMDPELFDLLSRVDNAFGGGNTIHVVSGYRSPEYNAILASRSSGVAKKSLHMKGLAVDFRLPGVRMRDLFRKVRGLHAGGAGYYRNFVHMDTGRVRTWGKSA
jgi:uncharacterized protein YcbK (DUF882 family)